MRNVWVASVLFLVACGGGGLENGNGFADASMVTTDLATGGATADLSSSGGMDLSSSSADLATSFDAGPPGDVSCGTMTCTSGVQCCVTPNNGHPTYACMDTCGTGTIAAACDGPEDCSGESCCGNIALSGNTASGAASCQSSTNDCSTGNIDLQSQSIRTKLCHTSSQCAGYMGSSPFGGQTDYDTCCTYGGVSYSFCAPSFADGFMGITCN